MKVIKLEVRNFLGVKSAEISPGECVVYIEGKNGAGKSSIVNSLWAALGGKGALPEHPIRNGADTGEISIDLGEITVTRKFTDKGTYLDVRNKEKMKFNSPQQVLDALFNAVSFDPQAFVGMRAAERREVLLELTGKRDELERLEVRRKTIFDQRTEVNRTVKNNAERLQALPANALEPVEPTSSKEVLERLRAEQDRLSSIASRQQQITNLKAEITERQSEIENNERRIKEYEQAIEDLKNQNLDHAEVMCRRNDQVVVIEKEINQAAPDKTAEIEAELEQVEAQNEKARQHKEAVELKEKRDTESAKSDELTRQIDDLDRARIAILGDSKLPVENLSLDGETLLIGGVPFDDLSTSEKLRLAIKIGIASNPKLRVMRINNGSELDSDNLAELEKLAEEMDVQIWVECVTDGAVRGYLVEAGEIKQPAAERASA